MSALTVTSRTRLRRMHARGSFDPRVIHAILDAQPLCHIAYVRENGPAVLPTLQWREGDHVYWHGSSASHALRAQAGADVCLAVTLLDGFVLARSAFHHSCNYRSVMLFGKATAVETPAAKRRHLETFLERLFPGRWKELRPIRDQEVRATAILRLPIREASAKIQTGPPADDEEDLETRVWAGVIPVRQAIGPPEADAHTDPEDPLPSHVRGFRLG